MFDYKNYKNLTLSIVNRGIDRDKLLDNSTLTKLPLALSMYVIICQTPLPTFVSDGQHLPNPPTHPLSVVVNICLTPIPPLLLMVIICLTSLPPLP